jgi:hypothetical protein
MSTTINPGVCKGCGAAILWIKNEKGNAEPFDAQVRRVLHVEGDRMPGGTVVAITYHGEGWASPASEWKLDSAHLPHFITCPKRDQFKTTGRKETAP